MEGYKIGMIRGQTEGTRDIGPDSKKKKEKLPLVFSARLNGKTNPQRGNSRSQQLHTQEKGIWKSKEQPNIWKEGHAFKKGGGGGKCAG